jgi:hypothetical protein
MYTNITTTDMLNKIILNMNEKHTMENYRCGRFTTKASFSIEFNKDKGFRPVLEYTNPEDGRLIGPHYSNYEGFACAYRNEEGGNINFHIFRLWRYEDINPFAQFMAQHFDTLQPTKDILKKIYNTLFLSIAGNVADSGANFEALADIADPTLRVLKKGIDTDENIFSKINLDVAAIAKTERPHREKKTQTAAA